MIIMAVLFGMVLGGVEVEDATPESVIDRDAWQPAIREVFEQLDTLEVFAMATRVGGITVKIPSELQSLPARMIEGTDELRERGIEIYLKEVQFRDLKFQYEDVPDWSNEHPRVPSLIEFGRLAFSADAKTRMGTFPVGATFENGRLPTDFLPMLEKGFDLNVIPEARQAETLLDNVRLQVGGRLTTGIANRFFSEKVAQLILEHGVDQTLRMGQGDLLDGNTALRLLDIKSDSRRGQAVESLLDGLRGR